MDPTLSRFRNKATTSDYSERPSCIASQNSADSSNTTRDLVSFRRRGPRKTVANCSRGHIPRMETAEEETVVPEPKPTVSHVKGGFNRYLHISPHISINPVGSHNPDSTILHKFQPRYTQPNIDESYPALLTLTTV